MAKTRATLKMIGDDDPQFARFWDAYPKRVSKKEARHAWWKLQPSAELVGRMVEALAWQVPLRRWDGDKYEYAPYPASWLNGRRWEDEAPPKPTNSAGGNLKGIGEWLKERVG